jgi:hypothetical protein
VAPALDWRHAAAGTTWAAARERKDVTMEHETPCRRCGSRRIIPQVRIIDHEEGYDLDLEVAVYERPDAGLDVERRAHQGSLRADVCADCGHAELYVNNLRELWKAHRQASERAVPG